MRSDRGAVDVSGLRIRYLGGPTALIEYGALRLLVDPTFDPAGDYPIGARVLTKTADAVVGPDQVGDIDAVLLSHDQHPDNLDAGGRAFLAHVPLVLSTPAAQERLGAPVRGLTPWAGHRCRRCADHCGAGTARPTGQRAVRRPGDRLRHARCGAPTRLHKRR